MKLLHKLLSNVNYYFELFIYLYAYYNNFNKKKKVLYIYIYIYKIKKKLNISHYSNISIIHSSNICDFNYNAINVL